MFKFDVKFSSLTSFTFILVIRIWYVTPPIRPDYLGNINFQQKFPFSKTKRQGSIPEVYFKTVASRNVGSLLLTIIKPNMNSFKNKNHNNNTNNNNYYNKSIIGL